MNYQKNIFSYENRIAYKYPYNNNKTLAEKIFKKKFHHSTFSCYDRLQDLAYELSRISKLPNKADGTYSYSKKKGLLNIIKRCLYARYADNLKDCTEASSKICNVPAILNPIIMSTQTDLFKNSITPPTNPFLI